MSAPIVELRSEIVQGPKAGIAVELNSGVLALGGEGDTLTYYSNNKGYSWAAGGALTEGLHHMWFLDSQGNIYFGDESGTGNTVAAVWRSSDGGQTYTSVLTLESSASWHMVELSNGDLYLSEYSVGSQNTLEKYAYNVWKSTNQGVSWSKFYTHAAQSAPGAKDGIRHIHILAADSADNLYIAFGEAGWGTDGGCTYQLNSNGTLGTQIANYGNGFTAFVQADDGTIYFGTDGSPNKIYKYVRATNLTSQILDISSTFGSVLGGGDVFAMMKGKDGVLYTLLHGSSSIPSGIIASYDDGVTWCYLKFQWGGAATTTTSYMTLNKMRVGSRIYISLGTSSYISIPDFTKAELKRRCVGGGRQAI